MKTLKESLLTDTGTKVSKFSASIKIDTWIKKNLPDNVGKYTVSSEPNSDGMYVVTLKYTDTNLWPLVKLDFKGTETTNGLFVFDIDENVRMIYVSGNKVKSLDGFDGITSNLFTIMLRDMPNLVSMGNIPKTKEFKMERCSKIKTIKLPQLSDFQSEVRIEKCESLTSIEFVCAPHSMSIRDCPKPIKFINTPDKFGKLSFTRCTAIKNLKGLPSELSNLVISDCGSFSSLKGDVKEISNNLEIINCPNFTNFKGIPLVNYELFVERCPITDWKVERKGKGRWFRSTYMYLPKGTKKPQWGVDGYWDEKREYY